MSLLATITLAGVPPSEAARCPAMAGGAPSLAEVDADERLRFLQRGLHVAARRARIWAWSFGATYAALSSAQLVAAPLADAAGQRDLYFGAAAAAVGVITLAVSPLKVMRDQRRLDRLIAGAGSDDASRCSLLAEAERLLVRDADAESFGKSPVVHAGNLVFNIGLGLALGLAFDHWSTGARTMMLGSAVGEVMIVAQPDASVQLLARYRAGDLSPASTEGRPRPSLMLVPAATRDALGLTLVLGF